jgi:predicted phage terminase large subunit-like protein
MTLKQDELAALIRRDFYTFFAWAFVELNPDTEFLPNWHIEAMCATLQACAEGRVTRQIINVPPRYGKSLAASVALPAFILGHNPSARILCVSYGQELADKHSRDCMALMKTPGYQQLFPTRLSSQRQAVGEFMTTKQGYRIATSIGGAVTGKGADFIILDDPLQPDAALSDSQRQAANDYYDHTLYSRLNNKTTGRVIVVMQRLHQDDLVGHVLEQERWNLLALPAIAEQDELITIDSILGTQRIKRRAGDALHAAREPLAALEQIKKTIGSYNFAGQYQQTPAPLGGGLIKAEWFLHYELHQLPSKFDQIIQSWDTANKPSELSDFSVCTTWGLLNKHFYLINVFRKRLNYPDLKRAVREQRELFNATVVLIEDKASGTQLIQEFVSDGLHGITRYEPQTDKIMRMHAQSGMIENGFVHIPCTAHWLDDYLLELTTFPRGKFDDQVDSTAQALDWAKQLSLHDFSGWIEFYRREAERAQGGSGSRLDSRSHPRIAMQAPNPHQSYYFSGTNGRAGRYTSNADGRIEDVHPDDIAALEKAGFKIIKAA